jgi:hypothetical protein
VAIRHRESCWRVGVCRCTTMKTNMMMMMTMIWDLSFPWDRIYILSRVPFPYPVGCGWGCGAHVFVLCVHFVVAFHFPSEIQRDWQYMNKGIASTSSSWSSCICIHLFKMQRDWKAVLFWFWVCVRTTSIRLCLAGWWLVVNWKVVEIDAIETRRVLSSVCKLSCFENKCVLLDFVSFSFW